MDKTLIQALIYSLALHLILFGTFRIRLNDYHDYTQEMKPLHVAIEPEDAPTLARAFTEDAEQREGLFIKNLDPKELSGMHREHLSYPMQVAEFDLDQSKLTFAPKMYPLQLKLSRELKSLHLLEDGSSLFRVRRPRESLSNLVLASNHFPIEYDISVDGKTGTLLSFKRNEVLLDRRLQTIADRIIKLIRFQPFSDKAKNGKISLIFCCTGDEIKSYLNE